MPMTYILIDSSLLRMFKWHNKDSLHHDTAFSNQVSFYGKTKTGEILWIFLWTECLYYQ